MERALLFQRRLHREGFSVKPLVILPANACKFIICKYTVGLEGWIESNPLSPESINGFKLQRDLKVIRKFDAFSLCRISSLRGGAELRVGRSPLIIRGVNEFPGFFCPCLLEHFVLFCVFCCHTPGLNFVSAHLSDESRESNLSIA